jgi:hypothetical protein
MWAILEVYQGLISQALTVGALLGVVGGVVLFTVKDASLRLNAVTVGVFAGGLGMAVYQLVRLDRLVDWTGRGFSVGMKQMLYENGGLFWEAFLRVVQSAFIGAVVMLVFLAPGRALKGALIGAFLGMASGVIVWGILRLVAAPTMPQLFFGLLVAGVFLFLYDLMPVRE